MTAPSILVVDDQPINVQLLKRKLEREGIRVTAAYNGLEALACVKKELPDLILLDVMMPDMDGIEVCQRLQADEATRGVPVIFITARTTKESKLEGLSVGAVTQGIAHNLNNLLGVVIGYLDLVKAYYDKPEQVKKNAQHVEDAVQRIVTIIKQLSTLVVKSRPPLVKTTVQKLVEGGV